MKKKILDIRNYYYNPGYCFLLDGQSIVVSSELPAGLRFNLWFCGSAGSGGEDGDETEAPTPSPTVDPFGLYLDEQERIGDVRHDQRIGDVFVVHVFTSLGEWLVPTV